MKPLTGVVDRFDGRVLQPGDTDYDQARVVWNAAVDRRPRMIVRCATVADVAGAVHTARELDLEIGVRCGGHSVLGLAVPDGGLMIDLTPMGAARVDPVQRRAWVQGGALLTVLDEAAQRHGLATTAGNVSHTGVGGLTLGGGMGWLARQYGLACDNVTAFQVVTAEGEVIRASPSEHPDLYWGLRGGGGNFGVVTEFEFQLQPIEGRALIAEFGFPIEDGLQVMRGWRDLNIDAPRQATFTASIVDYRRVILGFVWVGEPNPAKPLVQAFRALGHVESERLSELSYLELQRIDDMPRGHAFRRYSKGHYLKALPDNAIEAFLCRGAAGASEENLPNVGLQAYGGAIAETPDDETAFSHRETLFEWGASAKWTHRAEDEVRIALARRSAKTLEPFASGVYVNMVGDEGDVGVRRAYSPHKLARLRVVKDRYDPDNVFHLNANIQPTPRAYRTDDT